MEGCGRKTFGRFGFVHICFVFVKEFGDSVVVWVGFGRFGGGLLVGVAVINGLPTSLCYLVNLCGIGGYGSDLLAQWAWLVPLRITETAEMVWLDRRGQVLDQFGLVP